ncbi:MAG: hypothetical protein ABSC94_25680 [Polyangiaceae bacterium]|jgi:hypothetical protein
MAAPPLKPTLDPATADPTKVTEAATKSVRPTAPEISPKPAGGHASIADTFERLLSADEIEAGIASLEQGHVGHPSQGVAPADLEEVRALFAQLAANHVRPVRDFVIDLRWSEATVDWLPICQPALGSLRRAAEKLELVEVCAALDRFSDVLSSPALGEGSTIGGDARQAILARYEDLSRVMPHAFALDLDRSQREAVILQSLLLQIPDVKKVTLDKMYAAGLSTLEAMLLATAHDIVATTGIRITLAEQIVERFRAYRDQIKATVPDATRARERERILELTVLLRRQNDDFERASQSWTREAEDTKRALRKARAQTMLDIRVELARLGEVERLTRIEKLPFEAKLVELDSFLREAREKYTA